MPYLRLICTFSQGSELTGVIVQQDNKDKVKEFPLKIKLAYSQNSRTGIHGGLDDFVQILVGSIVLSKLEGRLDIAVVV